MELSRQSKRISRSFLSMRKFGSAILSRNTNPSDRQIPADNPVRDTFVYNPELPPNLNHRVALLLIDPQNDFIAEWGSLCVEGAIDDSKRVADGIRRAAKSIDQIFVTLDTHQKWHIAHPMFWRAPDGSHPAPFTQITSEDLRAGKWVTSIESCQEWGVHYVAELEKRQKFNLIIWPEHCLVGSKGHAVYDCLSDALHEWEATKCGAVSFVMKGRNALSEHYSAFKAEVDRPNDPLTSFNENFARELDMYDEIIVAGQAKSHCVNHSVRDLLDVLPAAHRRKVVVVSDGCSTIKNFEKEAAAFEADMTKIGVRFLPAAEIFKA